MDRLAVIRDTLAKYSHVGIRGLSGINSTKKYRPGQILKKSIELPDGWATGYNTAPSMDGTSSVGIYDDSTDSEIESAIKMAIRYSFGKICLIAGDYRHSGDDDSEVVLSTNFGNARRGARFICYLN